MNKDTVVRLAIGLGLGFGVGAVLWIAFVSEGARPPREAQVLCDMYAQHGDPTQVRADADMLALESGEPVSIIIAEANMNCELPSSLINVDADEFEPPAFYIETD